MIKKFLRAGGLFLCLPLSLAAQHHYYPDPSFYDNGVRTVSDIPSSFLYTPGTHRVARMQVASDNKIVFLTSAFPSVNPESSGSDYEVVRLNPDGALDTSFNHTGVVGFTNNSLENVMFLMATLEDRAILLAGNTGTGGGSKIKVLKLRENGTPDSTFGTNGVAVVQPNSSGTPYYPQTIHIQGDGKILVAGHAGSWPYNSAVLCRLLPDGAPDLTFGTNGQIVTVFNTENGTIYDLVTTPDNKIRIMYNTNAGSTGMELYIIGLNSDGSVDNSYGLNGKTELGAANANSRLGLKVHLDQDNNIYVLARYGEGMQQPGFTVFKLDSSGGTVTGYGNNGKVSLNDITASTGLEFFGKLQPDNRLLLTAAKNTTAGNQEFLVVRLNTNGTADTSFAPDGFIEVDRMLNDYPRAIDMQSNGAIILGGYGPESKEVDTIYPVCVRLINDTLPPLEPPLTVAESISNTSFRFYPNPVNDMLYVEGLAQGTVLRCYNLLGREVLPAFRVPRPGRQSWALGRLPQGVYFIRIRDAEGRQYGHKILRQ